MHSTSQDEYFMQQALNLAAATMALASPNPQVGCVLVRGDEILGEGAHLYANYDHAEIVALKQAAERGVRVADATAYVTLEPCSHHGRTGPCADALIAAGIRRCVIATQDPNALVSGQGIAKLRAANIEVVLGTLQQPARDLNDGFAHFIQHRTPFVTLKAALSVDGKLAPPAAGRLPNRPHWLTCPAALHQVQLLRHASDAILTGIGTVLADDPALTDRTELPRRRSLLRVVVDTHLRVPRGSQLVRSANHDLLIFCGTDASTEKIAALAAAGAEVQPVAGQGGRLSLPAILDVLGKRGVLTLLLECGSHLNGSFLRENLVDRAILFYAESELGEQAIPFAQNFPSPYLFEQSLQRISRSALGPDAVVNGYLHDPWATR